MRNDLQNPFSDIVGPSSPVQKAQRIAWRLAEIKPETEAKTIESKSSCALILVHLLGLMDSAGLINCRGFHSSAITLLRSIEEATDCFAAIGIDNDAVIKWQNGKLKASDAAKIWTVTSSRENARSSDYRKMIRTALNKYSHCTAEQANWNIYLETVSYGTCTMQLNTKPMVINLNAYYIDRYLCVHMFELIEILNIVHNQYLEENSSLRNSLDSLKNEIEGIIVDFLQFINSEKLDISIAPEISRIKSEN